MRYLFITRGVPGSGKSTALKNWMIDSSSILSPDDLRLQYSSLEVKPDGSRTISQKNDNIIWKQLLRLLDFRMAKGETLIIDATHTTNKSIAKYRSICDQYRYKLIVIDFSDISLDICKERNRKREDWKRVPEAVIDRMYKQLQENPLDESITVLKPVDLFLKDCSIDPTLEKNFDQYKKIIHFGDIHGCWNPLKAYFDENPISDENAYVFCGDYLDRGLQNKEVLQFCLDNYKRSNFFFLEGNHECWLREYSRKGSLENIMNKDFLMKTYEEIKDLDRLEIKEFCKSLLPILRYGKKDKEDKIKTVIITHGGIPSLPSIFWKESDFIKGVGGYEDSTICDNTLSQLSAFSLYSIHGHRNLQNEPIHNTSNTFNLEGKIEFGGELRIVEFNGEDFTEKSYKNDYFKKEEQSIFEGLLDNPLIHEKKLDHGISSFNFTRDAFYNSLWDASTVKARGLFIDMENQKIIARSYDKFFNLGELEETSWEELEKNLVFPVTAWKKENGYLGLLSWNPKANDYFISSKSTNKREFAENFKRILLEVYHIDENEELKQYLKEKNVTFIFEVVDPIFDPHIIKYDNQEIYLLDIVKNDFTSTFYPYKSTRFKEGIANTAQKFNFKAKEKDFSAGNLEILKTILDHKSKEVRHEGWVIEDQKGFRFKVKSEFYKFWKIVRNKKAKLNPEIRKVFDDLFHDEIIFIDSLTDKYIESFIKDGKLRVIDLYEEFY